MIYIVLGVDPGPTPGIVRLLLNEGARYRIITDWTVEVVQCTAGALVPVLNALADVPESTADLTYEAFVVGYRASRSRTASAGKATRDMTRDLAGWAAHHDIPSHTYRATDVKPWATDERLDAAGLLEPTKGMRHARDAARHALFTAVRAYGLPDPLSRKGRVT
jgi:hypothetical protein